MAYPAVISLKQTLHRLLHSPHTIITGSSTKEILESAYNQVISLQQILTKFDDCSRKLNTLDEQIRDEVQKLEDFLEFRESNHFLAHSHESEEKRKRKRKRNSDFFEEIRKEIEDFCERADDIANDCVAVIGRLSSEEEEEEEEVEEDDDDEAAGLTLVADPFDTTEIKFFLLKRRRPNDLGVFQIIGLPGSGATIAATAIFEDLKHCFDCRAWISIGEKYEIREILLSILAQINEPNDLINGEGDEKIAEYLHESLKGRRYLIVLDDIRGVEIWNFFESLFPVQDNGSAVLLTPGMNRLLHTLHNFLLYHMDSRDQDCWWYLFSAGVFGTESCPPELEQAGRKIVNNCKSLSIVVVKIILLLLKAERTTAFWNNLAADDQNPMYIVDDELLQISKIKEELSGENNYSFLDEGKIVHLLDLIDFSDHVENIKEIFPRRFFPKMLTMSFFGMAGIGKTSLVKKLFEDSSILRHFDHHIWVNLGPEYQPDEILVDILAHMYPEIDIKQLKGDDGLVKSLCAQIFDKKCLIVLDDVWSKKPLHYIKELLPNIKGVIMVTTRLSKVAETGEDDIFCKMRLWNKEESWELFCQQSFGEEKCPLQLEKAGKKIVENCEGLPLMIVTIADLLRDVEKRVEYWNDAAQKNSPVFMAAYDRISMILAPSYDYLPQFLKVCFLYVGIFPLNKVVLTSKLIKFWIAEGFLEPKIFQTIEEFAAECLSELDRRSLIMVSQKGSTSKIKSCSLHSVFWHLSNNVGIKNRFFHAFNTCGDSIMEDMEGQRRLCIRNSMLLGIKDVRNAIVSISTARSFLCIGPPHQYPVPVYFDLRLLRLMDALAIRLYEFPTEVVKSYCLRYLALTYNGDLPSSVSELWNLRFLIVSRHLRIKSSIDSLYLPEEMWSMKELKHLQVAGTNLPNPSHGIILKNLLTLLDVSADSCTKKVLKRVPNLKKLGIQIEMDPDGIGNPFRRLRRLESLNCVVVNPEMISEAVPPPAPRSMFPLGLKKLSLSGLGYPWEYMKIISKLENLLVLKLRCYAFQGPEWKIEDNDFQQLQFLLIEDTDLVRWKFTTASLVYLKRICIKHCYQLEELPLDLSSSLETIEVVECNPSVENWAKQFDEPHFHIISSWDARK